MNKLSKDNKIVHGLWIGTTLSKIELLTIHSFIFHGHDFYLWAYDEIKTALPEKTILKNANEIIPHENIFRYKNKNQFGHGKGSLAGFSDIFRYKLLYEYGGWWVDMDVTCLKPFNFIESYVFRTHHSLKVVGNIIKCPPKSELMHSCYNKAVAEVDENNTDWHKPIVILNEMIIKYNLSQYTIEISNHDSWNIVRKLLLCNYKIPENWFAIHWINEEWRRNKIDKNFYFPNSTFYKLLEKHEIAHSQVSFTKQIIYWFKLSWIYAALKQFPSFIQYHLTQK